MPDAHAAEARKLDRLVFGEQNDRVAEATVDAVQRGAEWGGDKDGASGDNR
jgi:hypothetical protein